MKSILKFLTIAVCFLFSSGACKKNDGSSAFQSYMRFKLNGVQVECDNKIWASYKSTVGLDANITFYGHWQDNALDFQLFNYSSEITPGQYIFGPSKAYQAVLWPNGTAGNGIHYNYIAGNNVPGTSIAGSGQITIIEINAGFIKGSFDFITDVNPGTGLFMTVTNGEFKINR